MLIIKTGAVLLLALLICTAAAAAAKNLCKHINIFINHY